MQSIFKRSIELNNKIETFMDTISNSLLLFDKVIVDYLDNDMDSFECTSLRICQLESEADKLETEIKINLYKFLLLPDVRADLLSLIKSLDNIVDLVEEISKDLKIEKPRFPHILHKDIIKMVNNNIKSAECLLDARETDAITIYRYGIERSNQPTQQEKVEEAFTGKKIQMSVA